MKQKELLYFTVITALVLSVVFYSVELKQLETTEKSNTHFAAEPIQQKKYTNFVCPEWKMQFSTQSSNWINSIDQSNDILHDLFVSQHEPDMWKNINNYWLLAYQSPWRTKESYLNQLFIAAFWINELWCWSDSRKYWQKAAIIQFHQLLQKETNPKYEYIKEKTQELFMQAQYIPSNERLPQYSNDFEMVYTLEQLGWDMFKYTSIDNYKRAQNLEQSDPRYNPNNCVPVPVTNVITKRPLSRMDGILAFQPDLVNRVQWRWWYLPWDIVTTLDPAILVDNMLNLWLPIDNPYRWIVWWQQKWFRDFIKEQWLPETTAQNPTYSLYQEYKAWLKRTWKAQPNKWQNNNWSTSNTQPEQQNPQIPVAPLPSQWASELIWTQQPWWSVIIVPLPPTRPQQPWSWPSAGWVIIPDKPISNSEDTEMRKIEEQRLKEQEQQKKQSETITETITAPTTIIPINLWRTLRF
jgi:hypothetical protein